MADSPGLFSLSNRAFSRTLTINHLQVPSTQTDFPVLVNFTNSTFKSISNGGHVHRTDGFDIGFYSDSGLTTKLKWEIERYTPSTGEIVAWVKIASVSSASDTVFYMGYGDPSITTDQSDPVNVWTNSFLGVYHLKDGTTLNVNSSTGSNNGTNHGCTATPGQVDGAANFLSSSSNFVDLGTAINPTAVTFTAWINASSLPQADQAILDRNIANTSFIILTVKSNGKLRQFVSASGSVSYDGTGSQTVVAGTYQYIALTYDSSAGLIGYINAVSDGAAAANGNITTTAASTYIGNDPVVGSRAWNGVIDEARVASVSRSANWITCEFNNQKSSSTFVTLGSEV